MSKLLSYDAIFAALAVVAIGSGCARSEAPKATAESVPAAPAPTAPGAVATTTAPPPSVEPSAGAVAADPSPSPSGAPAPVVAAKPLEAPDKTKSEKTQRNAAPAPPKKSAQAACGAGTCSADMKK